MLKVDEKFVNEFLGEEGELKDNYCSPCKTYRLYSKGKKMLIVRTPLMHEFNVNRVLNSLASKDMGVITPKTEEYSRGKYLLTVLTYE
jgi:hypothetical protein